MDDEHPHLTAGLDRDLEALRAGSHVWAGLAVARKSELLSACHAATGRIARRWTALAAQAKGIAGSPLEGEEALTGPWAVLVALNRYAETLRQIERNGAPTLQRRRVRRRPGGRLAVEVFPSGLYDRLLLPGVRGEVWMERDVTAASLPQTMGAWYRAGQRGSGVCLVLGAGNISSIGLLDVLYKLVADGRTCLLKIHPLLERLGPLFAQALAPLAEAGYVRFAYGGADAGRYLCSHALVDEIHVTGSKATYEAIAAGLTTSKPITSELGNVSPTIVVPGEWSDDNLRLAAEQIGTSKLHNDGFNCVALQVLVLPAQWNLRERLVAEVHRVLEAAPDRIAYYPGAAQRYAALVAHRSGVRQYGRDDAGFIPRTIVETDAANASEALFEQEAFGPILAVVALPGDTESYLRSAVSFCNERLAGNLAANLIVDPATARERAQALDDAIAGLRYGCIGVNAWSGVAFLLAQLPWGAYPGDTRQRIESGVGVVHNSRLFSRTQKSVVYGPFAPFPRRLRPPWLITHRNQGKIGSALCDFETNRSAATLAKIAFLTLTG